MLWKENFYMRRTKHSCLWQQMTRNVRKGSLCNLRITKTQTADNADSDQPALIWAFVVRLQSVDTVVYVDEQKMPRLVCTDVHADLDLRCPQKCTRAHSVRCASNGRTVYNYQSCLNDLIENYCATSSNGYRIRWLFSEKERVFFFIIIIIIRLAKTKLMVAQF